MWFRKDKNIIWLLPKTVSAEKEVKKFLF